MQITSTLKNFNALLIRKKLSWMFGAFLLVNTAQAGEQTAKQSASAYVIVDQSEKGFVVFTGLAHNTPPAKLADFRKKVNARDGVSMITWSEFEKNLNDYAKATMLVDDYPKIDAVNGHALLIEQEKNSWCTLGTHLEWGYSLNLP